MENQHQIQTRENKEIRLSGRRESLPLTTLSRLPTILRNEIEFPLFRESNKQIDVLNKIVAMLGVNFHDEEERKISASEWVLFVSKFKLTAPEIIEAYERTLRRELFNESNQLIKVFPNLSLITAGEILNAFIEFKKKSPQYENGLKQLNAILNPEKTETEEERAERLGKLWETVLEYVRDGREDKVDFGFLLFDDFYSSGKLNDVLPDKDRLHELQQEGMKDLVRREILKPLFFTKKELENLKNKIKDDEVLPVHNIVRIKIRDAIVVQYAKTILLKK